MQEAFWKPQFSVKLDSKADIAISVSQLSSILYFPLTPVELCGIKKGFSYLSGEGKIFESYRTNRSSMGYNLQQDGGMWSLREKCQVLSRIQDKLYKPNQYQTP